MAGDVRIGCSGWSYPHWRKRFYPEKLPAREHFSFYAQHFNTVELNNSFYRQPPPERFVAWRDQAPPGFVFSVKGSRYVTHIKRLAVDQKSIDLVVDGARGLDDKLGPILFQLQANFHVDLERLEHFVGMLPDDLRFSLEFRDDSWLVPAVFELLRAHRIALSSEDAEVIRAHERLHIYKDASAATRPRLRPAVSAAVGRTHHRLAPSRAGCLRVFQ